MDSDDGNCLLADEKITTGCLYNITKNVCRASLAARALSLSLCHCGIIVFDESSAALKGYANTLARSSWSRWV
jgi:hypothetical protein